VTCIKPISILNRKWQDSVAYYAYASKHFFYIFSEYAENLRMPRKNFLYQQCLKTLKGQHFEKIKKEYWHRKEKDK
jgi:hypothetical protein